jgi:Fe2+ or Zn2+ uptake regulation protein
MVDAGGIEAEIQKLARELDFRVDTHTLEFSGVCCECQSTRSS